METDPEAYCLMASLCGYMLIQPNLELPPCALEGLNVQPQCNLQLGGALLAEALRVRKGFNYVETPSTWSVITSFFLFGSYFCLDLHGTAWFHLREATTLALTLGTFNRGYRCSRRMKLVRSKRSLHRSLVPSL